MPKDYRRRNAVATTQPLIAKDRNRRADQATYQNGQCRR